jgi:methyl-accepting chemotaxis protein
VFNGSKHVGSVEFGLGFEELFVTEFSRKTGYPLAVVLLQQGKDGKKGVIGNRLPAGMDPEAVLTETQASGVNSADGRYFLSQTMVPDYSGKPIATAVIAVDRSMYQAIADKARNVGLAIGLLLLVIAGGALFYVNRGLLRPLRCATQHIARLAGGETDFEVRNADRSDEIGGILRALLVFRDNRIEQEQLKSQQQAESEEKLLRQQRVDRLIGAFHGIAGNLLATMDREHTTLMAAAHSMERIAGASLEQAESVIEASRQTSNGIASVASSSEELSSSIEEISSQAVRATEVVTRATHDTERSNSQIAALAEAANKIGQVVTLIQTIASQTNLLALNATIEAARAGEAGKGFAVVATEVKQLADQTSKATEEIAAHVQAIQMSTGEAVEAISAIATTMGEANQYTEAIASAVTEQGAATAEISSNIQTVATKTGSMVDSIGRLEQSVNATNSSRPRCWSPRPRRCAAAPASRRKSSASSARSLPPDVRQTGRRTTIVNDGSGAARHAGKHLEPPPSRRQDAAASSCSQERFGGLSRSSLSIRRSPPRPALPITRNSTSSRGRSRRPRTSPRLARPATPRRPARSRKRSTGPGTGRTLSPASGSASRAS